ncbi:PAS domain-containing protein [Streptomyces azureus]|uniref:Signal transduction histidine kinase regulating citrate/malate metabolism n=1 Tax=Streptomyces azureus TaxID=146537 RepID=A0A0K8PXH8_STRAJ|nr:PAS domain-containing protein [Streptomyces azureus]GAP52625.1 signal transduction histidine kinase regulating citrate/malate metabolism [Streptomyces azureus]
MIAFDPDGRITVVNDEARNLLRVGTVLGSRLDAVLPDGRLRRALDGTLTGTNLSVLTDDHCLVVNRMPVTLHGRELGAVVTVRDRTELIGLLRELDSVRGLTDACAPSSTSSPTVCTPWPGCWTSATTRPPSSTPSSRPAPTRRWPSPYANG